MCNPLLGWLLQKIEQLYKDHNLFFQYTCFALSLSRELVKSITVFVVMLYIFILRALSAIYIYSVWLKSANNQYCLDE